MISPAKVRKLRRLTSARVMKFATADQIIDAVSVAKKDMDRAEIAELLKGETPLWQADHCNEFMTVWVQRRVWYPFKMTATH
jgi:hypothetical protein